MNVQITNKDDDVIQEQNRELLLTPLNEYIRPGDVFTHKESSTFIIIVELSGQYYGINLNTNSFFMHATSGFPHGRRRYQSSDYIAKKLKCSADDIDFYPAEKTSLNVNLSYDK
ncbi:MAG: hypothetical protein PHY47_12785 [Lachnospiraceae bacterium]|nr:hypothetical protein [Lachnospiraceae bacterium]